MEARRVLAAPTFEFIDGTPILTGNEVIEVEVKAGAPLNIALNGADLEGDTLTFTANHNSTTLDLTLLIPEDNPSLRLTVQSLDPANNFPGDMVFGDMVFELFEGRVPDAVAKIIEAAEKDTFGYVGSPFHRVVDNFVIQAGDNDGFGLADGSGGPLATFDDQLHEQLLHTSKGILSLAKTFRDDSNSGQFFVTDRATRNLDGNHSVVGFLTVGDDVREHINSMPVDPNPPPPDPPDPPLFVITGVEIIPAQQDTQNAVLSFIVPDGVTGETDVTVTLSDGTDSVEHTIHVTVVADLPENPLDPTPPENTQPFLVGVPNTVTTTFGEPVTFLLSAVDVEGDPVVFVDHEEIADVFDGGGTVPIVLLDPDLDVSVDANGLVTVTPGPGAVGVRGIMVGVRPPANLQNDPLVWDTQAVAVLISPPAPSSIEIVGAIDGPFGPITDHNDGPLTADRVMFRVTDVFEEGDSRFFQNSIIVVVDPGTVHERELARHTVPDHDNNSQTPPQLVEVDFNSNAMHLDDGQHVIIVRQEALGQNIVGNQNETETLLQVSTPFILTVDTSAPIFLSTSITQAEEGTPFTHDVETDDEDVLGVDYELLNPPADITIDPSTGVITWQSPGPAGTHDVVVRATDAFGHDSTQEISIDVGDSGNVAPQFTSDVSDQIVDELAQLLIQFAADDPNNAGPGEPIDVLTFSLGDGFPDGATINPTSGLFTWTPSEEQGGLGTPFLLTVFVTDSGGLFDTAVFEVTVNEVHAPPTIDDIGDQTVNVDDVLIVPVMINDPDIPKNVLTVDIDTPLEGTFFDPNTMEFSWTPNKADGIGPFPVTLRVFEDGEGPAVETTFMIHVNQAPQFTSAIGPQTIDELTPLDIDPFTVDDPNNAVDAVDELRFSLAGATEFDPRPAGAEIDPISGKIDWTPSEEQGGLGMPTRFTVIVTDSGGLSDTTEFEVTVNEVNAPPTIDDIGPQTVNAGEELIVDVVIGDPDIPENVLTVTIDSQLEGTSFNLDTMQFSWTHNEADGSGPFAVTLRVEDEDGLADETTFMIHVNQAPQLTLAVSDQIIDELTELRIQFTADDPNNAVEPIDTLTFSLGEGAPDGATINPTSGLFAWTPSEEQGGLGTPFSLTVIVTDSGGLFDTTEFEVTVNEVNAPPAMEAIDDMLVNDGEELVVDVAVSDPDIPQNMLSVSIVSAPEGASFNPATMQFTWTPDASAGPGPFEVTLRVEDEDGLADEQTFMIHINQAPQFISAISPEPFEELTPLVIPPFTAFDPNNAVDPIDTLTFSLGGAPAGATIDPISGKITWTPTEEQGGLGVPTMFEVIVTDSGGLTDETSFSVTVDEVNEPPTMEAIGDMLVNEGEELAIDVVISDPDLPTGIPESTLDVTILSAPDGVVFDAENNRFLWTPTAADSLGPGPFTVTLLVSDRGDVPLSAEPQSFIIVVNRAPSLDAIVPPTVAEETELVFTVTASDPNIPAEQATAEPLDPDGFVDSLTYELVDGPAGMTIDASSGVLRWTPGESDGPGVIPVTVLSRDSRLIASEPVTFNVTVEEVNKPPSLAPIANGSTFVGQTITAQATAADADLPANPLTFSLVDPPPGASIDPRTGQITFLPPSQLAGQTVGITVRVGDGAAPTLFATQSFSVSVGLLGILPTFVSSAFSDASGAAGIGFNTQPVDTSGGPSTQSSSSAQGGSTSTSPSGSGGGAPNFQSGPDTGVAHIHRTDSEDEDDSEESEEGEGTEDGPPLEVRGQDEDASDETSGGNDVPENLGGAKPRPTPEITDSIISNYQYKTEDMVFDELIGNRWEWSIDPGRWHVRDRTPPGASEAPAKRRARAAGASAVAESAAIRKASAPRLATAESASTSGSDSDSDSGGAAAAYAFYLPLLVTEMNRKTPGAAMSMFRRWRQKRGVRASVRV